LARRRGAVAGYVADVVHGHDWQAALAPAYLNYDGGDRPGTVITIHNLAFQGIFAASTRESIGLPPRAMSIDGVEYYGGIGYLKAGIRLADRITTVSPTYAREIMTPEFGMALEGLLLSRARDVEGIVNGIDDSVWNPAADPSLPHNYTAFRIDQRAGNRAALETRFGLAPNPDAPIFAVVSRLTTQKGLDLLLQALPLIIEQGGRLAVLGTGEAWIQDGFALAAQSNPGAVGFVMGYDEALAHVIQAGTDFLLVPSRFEPCGLTQLCALRYGATPIVARVGGLADTIIDANEAALTAGVATGIQFHPPNASELEVALRRAFALFSEAETMRRVRVNGMRADVSWRGPAKRYAAIYRALAVRAKA
jgi:starch synthase